MQKHQFSKHKEELRSFKASFPASKFQVHNLRDHGKYKSFITKYIYEHKKIIIVFDKILLSFIFFYSDL